MREKNKIKLGGAGGGHIFQRTGHSGWGALDLRGKGKRTNKSKAQSYGKKNNNYVWMVITCFMGGGKRKVGKRGDGLQREGKKARGFSPKRNKIGEKKITEQEVRGGGGNGKKPQRFP